MDPRKNEKYYKISHSSSVTSGDMEDENQNKHNLPYLILSPNISILSLNKSSCASTNSSELNSIFYQHENTCVMGRFKQKGRSKSEFRKAYYIDEYCKENVECSYRAQHRTIRLNQPRCDDFPKENHGNRSDPSSSKRVQIDDPRFHRTIAAEPSKSHNNVAYYEVEKEYPTQKFMCVTFPSYNVPDYNTASRTNKNNSRSRGINRRERSHHRTDQRHCMDYCDNCKHGRKPSKRTTQRSSSDTLTSSDDNPDAAKQNNPFRYPCKGKCYEEFLKRQRNCKLIFDENFKKNYDFGVQTTDDDESANISVRNKSIQKDDSRLAISDGEIINIYEDRMKKEPSSNSLAVIALDRRSDFSAEKYSKKSSPGESKQNIFVAFGDQDDESSAKSGKTITDLDVQSKFSLEPTIKRRMRGRSRPIFRETDYDLAYMSDFPNVHRTIFGPTTDDTLLNSVQTIFDFCVSNTDDEDSAFTNASTSNREKRKKKKNFGEEQERRERTEKLVSELNERYNSSKRKRSQSSSKPTLITISVKDGSEKSSEVQSNFGPADKPECPHCGKFAEIKRRLEDGKPMLDALEHNDAWKTQKYMSKNRTTSTNSNEFKRDKSAQWDTLDFMQSNDRKMSKQSDSKQSNGTKSNLIEPYKINEEQQLLNPSKKSTEDRLYDEEKLNVTNYWELKPSGKLNSSQLSKNTEEQKLDVKTNSQINSIQSNSKTCEEYCKEQNFKLSIPDNWDKKPSMNGDKKLSIGSRIKSFTRKSNDKPKSVEMQPFFKQDKKIDDEIQLIDDGIDAQSPEMDLDKYIAEPKIKTEPQPSLRKFNDRSNLNKSAEKQSIGLLPVEEQPNELGADTRGISKSQLSKRLQSDTQQMDTHLKSSGMWEDLSSLCTNRQPENDHIIFDESDSSSSSSGSVPNIMLTTCNSKYNSSFAVSSVGPIVSSNSPMTERTPVLTSSSSIGDSRGFQISNIGEAIRSIAEMKSLEFSKSNTEKTTVSSHSTTTETCPSDISNRLKRLRKSLSKSLNYLPTILSENPIEEKAFVTPKNVIKTNSTLDENKQNFSKQTERVSFSSDSSVDDSRAILKGKDNKMLSNDSDSHQNSNWEYPESKSVKSSFEKPIDLSCGSKVSSNQFDVEDPSEISNTSNQVVCGSVPPQISESEVILNEEFKKMNELESDDSSDNITCHCPKVNKVKSCVKSTIGTLESSAESEISKQAMCGSTSAEAHLDERNSSKFTDSPLDLSKSMKVSREKNLDDKIESSAKVTAKLSKNNKDTSLEITSRSSVESVNEILEVASKESINISAPTSSYQYTSLESVNVSQVEEENVQYTPKSRNQTSSLKQVTRESIPISYDNFSKEIAFHELGSLNKTKSSINTTCIPKKSNGKNTQMSPEISNDSLFEFFEETPQTIKIKSHSLPESKLGSMKDMPRPPKQKRVSYEEDFLNVVKILQKGKEPSTEENVESSKSLNSTSNRTSNTSSYKSTRRVPVCNCHKNESIRKSDGSSKSQSDDIIKKFSSRQPNNLSTKTPKRRLCNNEKSRMRSSLSDNDEHIYQRISNNARKSPSQQRKRILELYKKESTDNLESSSDMYTLASKKSSEQDGIYPYYSEDESKDHSRDDEVVIIRKDRVVETYERRYISGSEVSEDKTENNEEYSSEKDLPNQCRTESQEINELLLKGNSMIIHKYLRNSSIFLPKRTPDKLPDELYGINLKKLTRELTLKSQEILSRHECSCRKNRAKTPDVERVSSSGTSQKTSEASITESVTSQSVFEESSREEIVKELTLSEEENTPKVSMKSLPELPGFPDEIIYPKRMPVTEAKIINEDISCQMKKISSFDSHKRYYSTLKKDSREKYTETNIETNSSIKLESLSKIAVEESEEKVEICRSVQKPLPEIHVRDVEESNSGMSQQDIIDAIRELSINIKIFLRTSNLSTLLLTDVTSSSIDDESLKKAKMEYSNHASKKLSYDASSQTLVQDISQTKERFDTIQSENKSDKTRIESKSYQEKEIRRSDLSTDKINNTKRTPTSISSNARLIDVKTSEGKATKTSSQSLRRESTKVQRQTESNNDINKLPKKSSNKISDVKSNDRKKSIPEELNGSDVSLVKHHSVKSMPRKFSNKRTLEENLLMSANPLFKSSSSEERKSSHIKSSISLKTKSPELLESSKDVRKESSREICIKFDRDTGKCCVKFTKDIAINTKIQVCTKSKKSKKIRKHEIIVNDIDEGFLNKSIVKLDSKQVPPTTPVIEVHDDLSHRMTSEMSADKSFDKAARNKFSGMDNRDAADGAAGDTSAFTDSPRNTRYALTRIKEYEEFTSYEILRKPLPRPKATRPKTERVFILKNK